MRVAGLDDATPIRKRLEQKLGYPYRLTDWTQQFPIPNQVRGRVFSTEFAMFTLTSAIGAAVAGVVLDSVLGISGTIGWMAALTLFPGILWWFWMAGNRSKGESPK